MAEQALGEIAKRQNIFREMVESHVFQCAEGTRYIEEQCLVAVRLSMKVPVIRFVLKKQNK